MTKAIGQFAVLAVLFFAMWFGLSRLDFVHYFNVEQLTKDNERKLGSVVLDAVESKHPELESDSVNTFVKEMEHRLCLANAVQDSSIKLHILVSTDVNAFTLPDRHLVVYTGLIKYCKSPEELSGVIAHEIGHMEHGDVMKKLVKEVGLSMMMAVAGGDAGSRIVQNLAQTISSTAFDREQESAADAYAVHMMAKANIDPEHLADIFFRLSQEKDALPSQFEWLSTHPNSQDRSAAVLKLRKNETFHEVPIADSSTWAGIRELAGKGNTAHGAEVP
jgi:predicted Zn-dependent protease